VEDEPVEIDFDFVTETGDVCPRRPRPNASPRERRVFIMALTVSLTTHGALLGAAVVVLNRQVHRPPTAGIVRGDQGGDASLTSMPARLRLLHGF
jgi:hypothetical protein